MKTELLAPAKNKEVAFSAIDCGADAIYIGAPLFGARINVANSIEDIKEVVDYAHKYWVKVFVAMNTILTNSELDEALKIIEQLQKIGVDALIIQDMGLLKKCIDLKISLPIHISTQCDNYLPEKIMFFNKIGVSRVVLARELSIEQISKIHKENPNLELEAFVHGALCVSYSGRCYLSEVLMDRSANRGCCAQLCRQRYDLLDKDGNEILDAHGKPIHQRYLLSLQDMDRSLHLAQMIEAGVTTFKIEGRLKDRDYVTNIVAYYRQLLDQIIASNPNLQQASTPSVQTYNFTPNPAKTFHRGQTDYFLHKRTPQMANWDTPKSTGEKIGRVVALRKDAICVQLQPNITLHNGDGICFEDKGFAINRVEGEWIYPNQMPNIQRGTILYRNLDTEFLRSLQAKRQIPVDIRFEVIPEGYRLTIGEKTTDFVAEHQEANNTQRALQTIIQQLSKLGDTDFAARNIQVINNNQICSEHFPYFIPISQLNLWRRQLTQI